MDVNLNWARHGRRVTAYNAFVEPILGVRKSLDVIKYARVTEVQEKFITRALSIFAVINSQFAIFIISIRLSSSLEQIRWRV